jgi:hypothetical protein
MTVVHPFQSFHPGSLVPHTVPTSMVEFLRVSIDKGLLGDYESATAHKATISGDRHQRPCSPTTTP